MQDDLLSLHILGVRIDEPVTVLTDIIIAAVCIYAFIRLSRTPGEKHIRKYLTLFFLFLGVGAFLGGVLGHGFLYALPPAMRLPGWMISMIAIAILEHVSVILIRDQVSSRVSRMLVLQNVLLLPVFLILLAVTQDFMFEVIYITFGILIMVGGMHLVIYIRSGAKGALWFILAVGTGLIGDFVFVSDPGLHDWFNKNDLSHILLIFTVWFFYLGARLFLSEENGVDLAGHAKSKGGFQE